MPVRVRVGDDLAAIVRAAKGEGVTLVLDGGDTLEHALMLAAIAPLAIERAPMRINAVVVAPGAESVDVDAAVAFLDSAESTTGQVLQVR